MTRRWKLVWPIVFVALVAGGIFAPRDIQADGDSGVIHVDAGAVALTADGLCSMTEAVANLNAHSRPNVDCASGDGASTIRLAAGTYAIASPLALTTDAVIEGTGAMTTVLDGGGTSRIFSLRNGTVTISGVTLRGGSATNGGAIATGDMPTLNIIDSAIEDNSATSTHGGAIYFAGDALNIVRSTFEGNMAKKLGAAVGMPGGQASVTVANSTFVDNTAVTGGLFDAIMGNNDHLVIKNSTFLSNDSGVDGGVLQSGFASLLLANSIIAKGSATHAACTGSDEPYITGAKANLTDDASCTRAFGALGSNGLAAIALNDGETRTIAPLATSGAIDTGDDTTCASSPVDNVDQRGKSRLSTGAHCDIGAVEVQSESDNEEGASLSGEMTVSGTFAPGSHVTYTVTITNNGPGTQDDNEGPEFSDVLPASLRLLSAAASSGSVTADLGTRTVQWDGTLAAHTSVTITIVAEIRSGSAFDVIDNQGTIAFDGDGDGANETTAVTDDPATSTEGDATRLIVVAPIITASMLSTTSAPYHPGDTISYTVTVTNSGNGAASNVIVTPMVDASASLVADSVADGNGNALSLSGDPAGIALGSIAAGGEAVVAFDVTIMTPLAAGVTSVTNQATVSGTNFVSTLSDSDDATGGASANVEEVVTTPALSLHIAGGSSGQAGDTVTYSLAYANTGDVGLTGVVLSATAPDASIFVAGESSPEWSCTPGTGAGASCVLTLGAIPGGGAGSATFSIVLNDVVAAQTLSFTASISDGTTHASDTATTTVLAPELSTELRGPAIAYPGKSFAYQLVVGNSGTAAATGLAATLTLPDGLSFMPSPGCGATGQLVHCELADIDGGGGAATVAINVLAGTDIGDRDRWTLSAAVTRDHAAAAITTPAVTTTVQAIDMSITGTADVERVAVGGQVTYTLSYGNRGSADATGASLTVTLPADTSVVTELSDEWACVANVCTLPIGTVAAGATEEASLTLVLDVESSAATIVAVFGIGDDGDHGVEADGADNVAEATTTIVRPDLAVSLSGPTEVSPGDRTAYTVVVENDGVAPSGSLSIVLELPSGLAFDSATSSQGCAVAGTQVTCAGDSLDAAGTATFTVGALADKALLDGTQLRISASVTPVGGELIIANNTSEEVVTKVAAADLAVAVQAPATVRPNTPATFTITVTNKGSAPAASSVVTVHLPDGITFDAAGSDDGCGWSSGDVTCLVGDIAAGASQTLEVAGVVDGSNIDGTVLGVTTTARTDGEESSATVEDNSTISTLVVTYLVDVEGTISGPATGHEGDALTLVIALSNAGDDANIEFDYSTPAGAVLDGVIAPTGLTCEALATPTLHCSGQVSAEAERAVEVTLHFAGGVSGEVVHRLSGTAFTGDKARPVQLQTFSANYAATMERVIDTRLSARVLPTAVLAGTDLRYRVTVTNAGDSIVGAVLRIELPAGMEPVDVGADTGVDCQGGETVECSMVGDFGRNASVTVTVRAHVDAGVAPDTALDIVASFEHQDGHAELTTRLTTAAPPPSIVIALPDDGDEDDETTGVYTYTLGFRWSLITWVGENGIAPDAALAPGNGQLASGVTAVYSFDTKGGQWLGYFPGSNVNGGNDLAALEFGRPYWVAIDDPGGATWSVRMGAPGE